MLPQMCFWSFTASVNSTKFVILWEKSTEFLQQKIGKKPS
jgi:hypothetical protein